MAGILSWIFTYPQDVLKSRLQADGFGTAQKYLNTRHCLQCSIQAEGYGFLMRGVGSTVIRAFPMNAVTFGVYSYIMKNWGYKEEDSDLDTIENLRKNLGIHVNELANKIAIPWGKVTEKEECLVSTMATDMPNIITIQERMFARISLTRMYPEQMLWACTETPKEDPWEKFKKNVFSDEAQNSYCNYNQFSQRNPMKELYQATEVMPPSKSKTNHQDQSNYPAKPSLLSGEDEEKWKNCIRTKDFLLPANLLSSRKSPDRIYGFYYLVV